MVKGAKGDKTLQILSNLQEEEQPRPRQRLRGGDQHKQRNAKQAKRQRHQNFNRIEKVNLLKGNRNHKVANKINHLQVKSNNLKVPLNDYYDEYNDLQDEEEEEEEINNSKLEDAYAYDDYDDNLADALNNTKKAQVDVVFFNRVPKVGSQSLMELMARLGKANNFVHSRDKGKAHETILLKPNLQKELIDELYDKSQPRIYSQHIAYINFTQFHMPQPIYINLVRDPIERIRSWHYYIRAKWYYRDLKAKLGDKAPKMPAKEFMEMDLDACVKKNDMHCQFNQMEIKNPAGDHRRQTLFFCGQNRKLCMPFNSKAAMQKAKRTVEEDYAVVGTWEETNITLTVLEHYIPKFFTDAKKIYYEGKDRLSRVNKNNVTRPISEETRMILRRNLTNEIEFYEFCKQRLYLQYAAISEDLEDNDDYTLIPGSQEYDDDDSEDSADVDDDNDAENSDEKHIK